jgi:hypothetical protein
MAVGNIVAVAADILVAVVDMLAVAGLDLGSVDLNLHFPFDHQQF